MSRSPGGDYDTVRYVNLDYTEETSDPWIVNPPRDSVIINPMSRRNSISKQPQVEDEELSDYDDHFKIPKYHTVPTNPSAYTRHMLESVDNAMAEKGESMGGQSTRLRIDTLLPEASLRRPVRRLSPTQSVPGDFSSSPFIDFDQHLKKQKEDLQKEANEPRPLTPPEDHRNNDDDPVSLAATSVHHADRERLPHLQTRQHSGPGLVPTHRAYHSFDEGMGTNQILYKFLRDQMAKRVFSNVVPLKNLSDLDVWADLRGRMEALQLDYEKMKIWTLLLGVKEAYPDFYDRLAPKIKEGIDLTSLIKELNSKGVQEKRRGVGITAANPGLSTSSSEPRKSEPKGEKGESKKKKRETAKCLSCEREVLKGYAHCSTCSHHHPAQGPCWWCNPGKAPGAGHILARPRKKRRRGNSHRQQGLFTLSFAPALPICPS